MRVRATGYSWDPDRPFKILRDRLRGVGMSMEGAEAVAAQVEEVIQETETLNLKARPLRQRLYRLRRRAKWILGETGVQRAIDLGNDALIARASLTRAEEVSRLREVNSTDYWEQVWLQATETLKARLSSEDWECLRKYLLDQVVPGHHYYDFEWRIPEAQPLVIFLRLLIALSLFVGLPVLWLHRRIRRLREANG